MDNLNNVTNITSNANPSINQASDTTTTGFASFIQSILNYLGRLLGRSSNIGDRHISQLTQNEGLSKSLISRNSYEECVKAVKVAFNEGGLMLIKSDQQVLVPLEKFENDKESTQITIGNTYNPSLYVPFKFSDNNKDLPEMSFLCDASNQNQIMGIFVKNPYRDSFVDVVVSELHKIMKDKQVCIPLFTLNPFNNQIEEMNITGYPTPMDGAFARNYGSILSDLKEKGVDLEDIVNDKKITKTDSKKTPFIELFMYQVELFKQLKTTSLVSERFLMLRNNDNYKKLFTIDTSSIINIGEKGARAFRNLLRANLQSLFGISYNAGTLEFDATVKENYQDKKFVKLFKHALLSMIIFNLFGSQTFNLVEDLVAKIRANYPDFGFEGDSDLILKDKAFEGLKVLNKSAPSLKIKSKL